MKQQVHQRQIPLQPTKPLVFLRLPHSIALCAIYCLVFTAFLFPQIVNAQGKNAPTKEQIEEELQFIPEGGMPDMQVLTWDGQLLALELPQTVDLEIIETAPGIKGASASSRTKPATMSTGLVIQVPEYLTTGEKIRIHIEECRYMGRAD